MSDLLLSSLIFLTLIVTVRILSKTPSKLLKNQARMVFLVQLVKIMDKARDRNYVFDLLLIGLFLVVLHMTQRLCRYIKILKQEYFLFLEKKDIQLQLWYSRLKQLEYELKIESKDLNAAEDNILSLKKQFEEFRIMYDQVLAENYTLRNQLLSSDKRLIQLENEYERKINDAVESAEAKRIARSEGFLLECNRLIKENKMLRNQLMSLNWRLSHLASKRKSSNSLS
uniref:uncharacterized protein LOC105350200 n=1 Tax=Fragaria vesca subsp. vesca TaxID=101020 RepID=UPI0005C8C02F|nr:PREDICTED: uncharacterized protein LOC105350200 [Fragaria vesca subsp. vesca]